MPGNTFLKSVSPTHLALYGCVSLCTWITKEKSNSLLREYNLAEVKVCEL